MNAPAQKLTQQIFRALVTPERTRAIVELADLSGSRSDRAEVQRVIDQLVAARLLVVQTRGERRRLGRDRARVADRALADAAALAR